MTASERRELAALKAEVAELRKRNDELVDEFLKAMMAQAPAVQYVPYIPWTPQPVYPWITYTVSGNTSGQTVVQGGNQWFNEGANPQGIVASPLSEDETRAMLKAWTATHVSLADGPSA